MNTDQETVKLIHLEKARELLKAAMETQGRDFIYQDYGQRGAYCYNLPVDEKTNVNHSIPADSNKRKTGCIAGTAMKLSGAVGRMPFGGSVDSFAGYLEKDARDYLQIAQNAQDYGASWGQAFDLAESSIDNHEAAHLAAANTDWWAGRPVPDGQKAALPLWEPYVKPKTEAEYAGA